MIFLICVLGWYGSGIGGIFISIKFWKHFTEIRWSDVPMLCALASFGCCYLAVELLMLLRKFDDKPLWKKKP